MYSLFMELFFVWRGWVGTIFWSHSLNACVSVETVKIGRWLTDGLCKIFSVIFVLKKVVALLYIYKFLITFKYNKQKKSNIMCLFFLVKKKPPDTVLEGFTICTRINCCFFKWHTPSFEKTNFLTKKCRYIILRIYLVDQLSP